MPDYPPGWEWLREPADLWVAPEELRRPTNSPVVNLAIQLIVDRRSGNNVVSVSGKVLTAHADFNVRVGLAKSRGDGDIVIGALRSDEEESHRMRDAYEAWIAYRDLAAVAPLPLDFPVERRVLIDALLALVDFFDGQAR